MIHIGYTPFISGTLSNTWFTSWSTVIVKSTPSMVGMPFSSAPSNESGEHAVKKGTRANRPSGITALASFLTF